MMSRISLINTHNTNNVSSSNSSKIIYKTLSYRLVGCLYDIFNQMGSAYHEKYYQKAFENKLKQGKFTFEREHKVDIVVDGKKIGKHFIDFVISGKIALDIKKGNRFRMGDIKQMLMYLKTTGLKLGILAYFGAKGVRIKRIVNSEINY